MNYSELDNYDLLIWSFEGSLFRLTCDWEGIRTEIAALFPRINYSNQLSFMISQAENFGVADQVFQLITRHEMESLNKKAGAIDCHIDLLRTNASRSMIVAGCTSDTLHAFFELYCIPPCPFTARDIVANPSPSPEGLERMRPLWEGKKCVFLGNSDIDEQLADSLQITYQKIEPPKPTTPERKGFFRRLVGLLQKSP